jgi:excinuclease ABC subunit A
MDLELRGVRTHNLKSVDVRFPAGGWTAVCGVSGSGKSSLAFHTLHAEAERRWLSTLPAWRRAIADALPRPPLDSARHLPPTLALGQEPSEPSGDFASLCGLREPLAALWAAASEPHSPATGEPMRAHAPDEAARALVESAPGARLQVRFEPTDRRVATWRERGFVRGLADGDPVELETLPAGAEPASLLVTVDRLKADERSVPRLREAIQTAYRLGEELCRVEVDLAGTDLSERRFSGVPRCTASGRVAPLAKPGLFSRRSPLGACPACAGSGGDDGNCPKCGGSGLREEASWFRLGGTDLPALLGLEASDALAVVSGPDWDGLLDGPCGELLREVRSRLSTVVELGLGYLPLSRRGPTLSQGEERRTRLATLVGSPLSGVCYVLDEPGTGLHPADLPRVHALLSRLRDGGATVVCVEHDLRSLAAADHVVETGPGPGDRGGRILYEGGPDGIVGASTPSGRWLSGTSRPPSRPSRPPGGTLRVEGVSGRNLSIPSLEIPLGGFVAFSGVSGAGKSSLLLDALVPSLRAKGEWSGHGLAVRSVRMDMEFDEIRPVDPGGEWTSSPRSTVATLSGMLDDLRSLFASLPESKARGWTASRFSPNAKGGRCERCEGIGEERIRLHLYPDAWVPCSRCGGSRYEPSTLEVRWKGLSVAEVLDLPLDRAAELLRNHPRLGRLCGILASSGLSHLSGGRRVDSLSGGEALRLRLGAEVAAPGRRRILWALDEPSRGLHPTDVLALLTVFDGLRAAGQTVFAATHDPFLVSRADHVVELGPGAGSMGGRVLFSGTPQGLAAGTCPSSESVARELS